MTSNDLRVSKIRLPIRIFMLVSAISILNVAGSLHAQSEDEILRLNILDIPTKDLTEEVFKKIFNAGSENEKEIEALQKQIRDLKKNLQSLEINRETNIKKLLSANQLEAISNRHLKNTRLHVASTVPFLRDFSIFSGRIAAAQKITIYEGLPRANQQEIDQIKVKSKTINLDGFDFYKEPLIDKTTVIEEFRSLLVNYHLYSPKSLEEKLCGGFHPDLCLQYHVDGREYRALICLGCWEIRVIGPQERFNFDLNELAFVEFKQLAKSIFVNHKPQFD